VYGPCGAEARYAARGRVFPPHEVHRNSRGAGHLPSGSRVTAGCMASLDLTWGMHAEGRGSWHEEGGHGNRMRMVLLGEVPGGGPGGGGGGLPGPPYIDGGYACGTLYWCWYICCCCWPP
jgi:hypothetical protein